MAVRVVLLPEAARDIADICDWCETHRRRLGDEFLLAVDDCVKALSQHPEMCPAVFEGYRRYVMRRFPYVIFYEYSEGVATVFGVFHAARDPRTWSERLL